MSDPALPYRPHDHDACVAQALADARSICKAHNARLTPIRERVLELIWQSHQPLGAYELLAALANDGRNAAPPTVYRALDFLQQYGLVHRIASLNAFIGCAHAGACHTSLFLICRHCRNTLEISSSTVSAAVTQTAQAHRFVAEEAIMEITGQCPGCSPEHETQPHD
ncbi:Fur family transcriptional regulator [Marinobacter sp. X15-166B]|uniref:Fur family transcriptional regulator n=1 Tax=Marinobacter sp. X15-166B TaxID=1897620 RepID=UPI00085CC2BD|nr:Fur family transcriptional regulator [Marinobacter sp. X15-166B]OEY65864.1 Fur family transcriptional regulator [Marinobacter sp. X15-166B]